MAHLAHKDLCEGNLNTFKGMVKAGDRGSMLFAANFLAVIKNADPEDIEAIIKSPYYDASEAAIMFCKGQKLINEEVVNRWMDSRSSSLRRAAVMAMSGWDVVPEDLKYRAVENGYESVRILAMAEL